MADTTTPKTPKQNKISFEEALEDENHTPIGQAFVNFFESCFTVPDVGEAKRFLDDVEPLIDALKKDEERLLFRIEILTGGSDRVQMPSKILLNAVKSEGKEEKFQQVIENAYIQLGSTRMAMKMLRAMIYNTTKTLLRSSSNPILQLVAQWADLCECEDCKPSITKP